MAETRSVWVMYQDNTVSYLAPDPGSVAHLQFRSIKGWIFLHLAVEAPLRIANLNINFALYVRDPFMSLDKVLY